MPAENPTPRSTADICHCRHPRHYHARPDGASPLDGDGVGACHQVDHCPCEVFRPIGARNPESSADLGIGPVVLHGHGQRYRVYLGSGGFYVLDHERRAEDGTGRVVAGSFASKSHAREQCDMRNFPPTPRFMGTLLPRRARKAWPCEGNGSSAPSHAPNCPATIDRGYFYIEYLGESGAYQSGSRHCIECAREFGYIESV